MGTRDRLVESALHLLETHGLEALNARRLAAEIGASTMVVYSNFGGMAGLYEALARESFARLTRYLRESPRGEDPVADLLVQAMIYRRFALADPNRYHLMFGVSAPGTGPLIGREPSVDGGLTALAEVNAAFSEVVETVRRCMSTDRLRPDDPVSATGQMWSLLHGYMMLELVGVFGDGARGMLRVFAPAAINLLVGLGGRRDAVEHSALAAIPRFEAMQASMPPEARRPATGPEPPAARRGRRPRPV